MHFDLCLSPVHVPSTVGRTAFHLDYRILDGGYEYDCVGADADVYVDAGNFHQKTSLSLNRMTIPRWTIHRTSEAYGRYNRLSHQSQSYLISFRRTPS